MNNKPLVSAVIIFLNEERFLEEAIKSVLEQSYDNWELMLVDDGSTDRSTEIAIHYAKQYPGKVRYLEHDGHQNRGSSAARNLGFKNAYGEYIAFLDGDDVWLPYKLERQVPILMEHSDAVMLYGKLFNWYSWTGDPDDINNDYEQEVTILPTVPLYKPLKGEEFLSLFVQRKVLINSNIFVRRKAIERVGGFEESFRGLFDDQVFIAKISLEGSVILVPEVFEKYRKHPDSCTYIAEKITGEHLKMRPIYLNWLENYMADLEIKDAKIWKALRKELLQYRHPFLWDIKRLSKMVIDLARNLKRKIVMIVMPLM